MNAYQLAQEWNDLRWGTVMPVAVMIGSKLVQVRARGSCSLAVTDPSRLEEKVPDPDNLTAYVRSLLALTITDMLGERSGEVSDVAQLTAITPQTIQALRTTLEPKLDLVGLKIKNVTIETIESL
ncbi:MAG TPA: SPFH domain-containing protein [Anaerolineales bacterium]